MKKNIDITGQKFGKWQALELDKKKISKKGTSYWRCQCECGSIHSIVISALINSKSTQCRSCSNRARRLDLPKSRYGEWNVLHHIGNGIWLCECSCGKQQEVSRSHLINHQGKSCLSCRSKFSKGKRVKVNIGDKYGKWTIKEIYQEQGFRTKCLCICECGTEKIKQFSEIKSRKTGGCQNCGKQWAGYKEISGTLWSGYKHSAQIRNLDFSITIEYAWDLFLQQYRKCSLTGLTLSFNTNPSDKTKRIEQTASLDRIDSSKGYIEGNIQWVHKKINLMKGADTMNDFILMCNLVSKHCEVQFKLDNIKFDNELTHTNFRKQVGVK